jgi:ribosomal protein L37AE/L43A
MFSKIANSAHWPHIKYDRSKELKMALARHKSRRVNAVSIPLACEVCREEPVTTLVADFIFACDRCAERIATALWHGRQKRVVAGENVSPDRETNRLVY